MILIDTHAHLYWDSYQEDLDQVIQRAKDAGVTTIINVGVDVEKSKEALRQAQGKLSNIPKFSVYSTIGIHPHEALRLLRHNVEVAQGKLAEEIEELEQIYHSNPEKVVAVGECGLDYSQNNNKDYNDYNYYNSQKKLFRAQINLAKKLKLPLIIHCRDAWGDTIEETGDCFGIYHCYSGQPEITKKVLKTNFLVSFAGNLTYPKNDYLRQAAKLLPLNRIVLETDCPFLPPQSKRGQRNEPSTIIEIAKLIADLKGISLEEVANQTTANASRLFAF